MRIMIDSNVFISAIVLSSPYLTRLIDIIAENHTIVLSTYIVDELKRTTKLKFPKKYDILEAKLKEIPYVLLYTPETINPSNYPEIRDLKDLPILVSALNEDVDIILTNDNDFISVDIDYPEIIKPHDFIKKYYSDK
ncbi:MAG: putative toxin-antitoxin system toxin component, PIN family [Oscillospiraceae bacterium]|nr:putative toxin-antitoxin system toxin component, PIN family [Oscillospiraceae bacterium]